MASPIATPQKVVEAHHAGKAAAPSSKQYLAEKHDKVLGARVAPDKDIVPSHKSSDPLTPDLNLKERSAATKRVGQEIGGKQFDQLKTTLMSLKPADRTAILDQLHESDPKSYGDMMSAIRSGDLSDKGVALAASVSLLNNTKWAQEDGENADITRQVQKLYDTDQITFAKGEKAGARTVSVNEHDGHTGRKGDAMQTRIEIDPPAAGSPEGMAATLAHEGGHSLRDSKGTAKNELREETDAHIRQSEVWNEFGPEKSTAKVFVGKSNEYEEDAAFYNPNDDGRMLSHIAGKYVDGHASMKHTANVKEILNDYFAEDAQRRKEDRPGLIDTADSSQLYQIYEAGKKINYPNYKHGMERAHVGARASGLLKEDE